MRGTMRKYTEAEIEASARDRLPEPRAHFRQLLARPPRDAARPILLHVHSDTHAPLRLDAPAAERLAYVREAAVRELTFELALVGGDAPGPEGFVCVDDGEASERIHRSPLWARWERRA